MSIFAHSADRPISRRAVLAAALLAPAMTACTSAAGTATVRSGVLHSVATGEDHDWSIWYPAGTDHTAKLPVVVVLHGLDDTIESIEPLGYTTQATALIQAGAAPFAIAAVNGDTLFWQKIGNKDAGRMLAQEFLAVLKDNGLDTSRLALTGWSMGGWGTLRLAGHELRGKLRAVAAISAPCYSTYQEVPEPYRKLLSKQEFNQGNFYNQPGRLAKLPIFLACGTQDPFEVGNEEFVISLDTQPGVQQPTRTFSAGGHDADYWRSVAPAQFAFLSKHLS